MVPGMAERHQVRTLGRKRGISDAAGTGSAEDSPVREADA
ncbi:MAG: hypothetical protein RIT17_1292, partial [Pseudomonadota bacterium]